MRCLQQTRPGAAPDFPHPLGPFPRHHLPEVRKEAASVRPSRGGAAKTLHLEGDFGRFASDAQIHPSDGQAGGHISLARCARHIHYLRILTWSSRELDPEKTSRGSRATTNWLCRRQKFIWTKVENAQLSDSDAAVPPPSFLNSPHASVLRSATPGPRVRL